MDLNDWRQGRVLASFDKILRMACCYPPHGARLVGSSLVSRVG
jgi:hypothetical protein